MADNATVTPPDQDPFVRYLEGLRDHGRRGTSAMFTLRRALGYRFSEAPMEAVAYVLPWCGSEPRYWPDHCRLTVAALFASHQLSWVHKEGDSGATNLGASMARLRAVEGEWIDRQMERVLVADRDTVDHYLISIIHQLAKAEIPIDWSVLLRDLLLWWPEGAVARRWARAYARQETEEENENDVA